MANRFTDEPMDEPNTPPRRTRGRPVGSRNIPKGPTQGVIRIDADKLPGEDDDAVVITPETEVETWVVCGHSFSTRKQGTPPPAVVIKTFLAVQNRELSNRDFLRALASVGAKLGENQLYTWVHNAGQPSPYQAYAIAKALGLDLEYLLDDDVPPQDPPPRAKAVQQSKLDFAMELLDLTMADVEKYVQLISTAKNLGIGRPEAVRMLTSGYEERVALRDHDVTPEPRRPVLTIDGPTHGETRQADADRRKDEGKQKNGSH